MKKIIRLTESDLMKIVKRVISEGNPAGPQTQVPDIKIAGPYTNQKIAPMAYYVYQKPGKYYIYQTNATQKTPIYVKGDLWSNSGQGYSTIQDVNKAIQTALQGAKEPIRQQTQDSD